MLNVLKWGLNFLQNRYSCFWFCMVPLFLGVPLGIRWCSVSISRCSTGVLGCSVVPPLFLAVPLFHRCSVFRCSVFRCPWFYSMPFSVSCDYLGNYFPNQWNEALFRVSRMGRIRFDHPYKNEEKSFKKSKTAEKKYYSTTAWTINNTNLYLVPLLQIL